MIPYIMEKTHVWNYQPASVVFMFSLLTITNGEATMNFLQFPIGFQRAKQASQVAGPLLIAISHDPKKTYLQREFQDPKMEVLHHIRPYFLVIFPYIGLMYGRYLQFRILPTTICWTICVTMASMMPAPSLPMNPCTSIASAKWQRKQHQNGQTTVVGWRPPRITLSNPIWLVVYLPLWKMMEFNGVRQLRWWNSQ